MNEEEAKKKISDIIFNALTSDEKITKEKEAKIREQIFDVLKQFKKDGITTSKEYKGYIETPKGTFVQTPEDYWHYHLSMVDDDNPMIDLTVRQEKNKHIIEDTWGDFGEEEGKLGEFNSLMEALIFAYGLMIKKYPKAKFCTGAGCPPDDLIELVKKELKL